MNKVIDKGFRSYRRYDIFVDRLSKC